MQNDAERLAQRFVQHRGLAKRRQAAIKECHELEQRRRAAAISSSRMTRTAGSTLERQRFAR